jgi:hypothetical protein
MSDYKPRGHQEAQMIPLMISAAVEVKGRRPHASANDIGESERRVYLAQLDRTRTLRELKR